MVEKEKSGEQSKETLGNAKHGNFVQTPAAGSQYCSQTLHGDDSSPSKVNTTSKKQFLMHINSAQVSRNKLHADDIHGIIPDVSKETS